MSIQSATEHAEQRVRDRLHSLAIAWFRRRCPTPVLADIFQGFDFLIIVTAAIIAKYLYVDFVLGAPNHLSSHLVVGLLGGVLGCVIFNHSGIYHSAEISAGPFRSIRLLVALLATFTILLTIAYIMKISNAYSPGWVISWFIISYVLLVANRAVYYRVKRWLIAKGIIARNVALIGIESATEALADTLQKVPGVHVVAVQAPDAPIDAIERMCGRQTVASPHIDEIIVTTSNLDSLQVRSILAGISSLSVQVRLCVDDFAYDLPFHGVSRLGQTHCIDVRSAPISHWGYLVKNFMDFVLGGLMLLLLVPVFLIVAALIKLDSKGPVFFRQRRHGLNHRVISVFKFRTMTVMEDDVTVVQAKLNDSRVTRVGALLRRTSLDELPQLFNVLQGQMSLVGPRPHALAHNEEYGELLKGAHYASRHLVKPGITGWAQVNGFRGPTEDPRLMRERVRYDLEYIDNWSPWFDLEILLLTLVYGFISKNAL